MVASLGTVIRYVSATPLRVWLSALTATIVFGLFDYDVSRSVIETNFSSDFKAALQATIVGIGAGMALRLFLGGIVQRRQQVREELERVAELNHTIRNSLEIIVLAHHNEVDQEHRQMILDCTRRIDLKLKELFPAPVQPRHNRI